MEGQIVKPPALFGSGDFLADEFEAELLGLSLEDLAFLGNPLKEATEEDLANPHIHLLKIIRQPEYFTTTCKYLFNINLFPYQALILRELWLRPFPMLIACRGGAKSFTLAVYILLRLLFTQGSKIVVVGAGMRQAKYLFDYLEGIWTNSHVYRDILGSGSGRNGRQNALFRNVDKCECVCGNSIATFIPMGNGQKIRGLRATHTIADEFASIPEDVYEHVVSPFAVVSADPIATARTGARKRVLKRKGLLTDEAEAALTDMMSQNQSVIAGSAYYDWNHFAKYWKRYKAIIESKGDKKLLREHFGENAEGINWRDYSIIRLPVEVLPEGLLEKKVVDRLRSTMLPTTFKQEMCGCFALDSDGFFSRRIIETCVVGRQGNPVHKPSCGEVNFSASIYGDTTKSYVFGVDPASETDNLAIIVLEVWPDHRRIVYCWTTKRSMHKERVAKGLTDEHDFFGFIARKIRDLLTVFPAQAIGIDRGGGGISIEEALHDPKKLLKGELPIWPIIEEGNEDQFDFVQEGPHLLHMINFQKADWVAEANFGMKMDFGAKALLFPYFDSLQAALAGEEDEKNQRLFDTLEDCIFDIEALKDELAQIIHERTSVQGRERWTTPVTTTPGQRKAFQRKDRYSALLIANMIARTLAKAIPAPTYQAVGGAVGFVPKPRSERFYNAPEWYRPSLNIGAVVRND